MDLMQVRRRMMSQTAKKLIDTSPKIVEYGKGLDYATLGERNDSAYCYTEWYFFDPRQVRLTIHYFINNREFPRYTNYQYFGSDSDGNVSRDWYYNRSSTDITRTIGGWEKRPLNQIRFTIRRADIDEVYAYAVETGQIFFAGKNSPYYGYTNINDMP